MKGPVGVWQDFPSFSTLGWKAQLLYCFLYEISYDVYGETEIDTWAWSEQMRVDITEIQSGLDDLEATGFVTIDPKSGVLTLPHFFAHVAADTARTFRWMLEGTDEDEP